MKIFVFGSSLTSSYWNGAATYYRGIYKNLHALGHRITFAEPDIYSRQQHRDVAEINYADVLVYNSPVDIERMLSEACSADLVIKHSGVGADDERLEREVLNCRHAHTRVVFWDVDAPATLARVEGNLGDPFRQLIPQYDFIFTYGGGSAIVEHYIRLGARNCHPIYNALDPDTHHPVSIAHVPTESHNRVNCSARMVLNINRDSMAHTGFSPPTRIFEAAGAGACLITDAWPGIDSFFDVGREILVASSASDIVQMLRSVSTDNATQIGAAMRSRALRDHTYWLRAQQVDSIFRATESAISDDNMPPQEILAA